MISRCVLIAVAHLVLTEGGWLTGPCSLKQLTDSSRNVYLHLRFKSPSSFHLEVCPLDQTHDAQFSFYLCYYQDDNNPTVIYSTLRNYKNFANTCPSYSADNPCNYYIRRDILNLTYQDDDTTVVSLSDNRNFRFNRNDDYAQFKAPNLQIYLGQLVSQSIVGLTNQAWWLALPVVSYTGTALTSITVYYRLVKREICAASGLVTACGSAVNIARTIQWNLIGIPADSTNTSYAMDFEVIGFQGYTRVTVSRQFIVKRVYSFRVPNTEMYVDVPVNGVSLRFSGWWRPIGTGRATQFVDIMLTRYNASSNLDRDFANALNVVTIESQRSADSRFFIVEPTAGKGSVKLQLANHPGFYLALANRQRLIAVRLMEQQTDFNYEFFLRDPPQTKEPVAPKLSPPTIP